MYTKYNCCPRPKHPASIMNCCVPKTVSKIDNTTPGAVPESVRIGKWQCSTAIVSVPNFIEYTSSCVTTIGTKKVIVPVPSGSAPPVVNVQNTSASATTAQRIADLVRNESDPYNPESRFAAYFPPAPLPYICPERIPNNAPKPSTADCVPIRRFQGSAQAAGLV